MLYMCAVLILLYIRKYARAQILHIRPTAAAACERDFRNGNGRLYPNMVSQNISKQTSYIYIYIIIYIIHTFIDIRIVTI